MKSLGCLTVAAMMIALSSCSSQQNMASSGKSDDGIYASSNTGNAEQSSPQTVASNAGNQPATQNYVANNNQYTQQNNQGNATNGIDSLSGQNGNNAGDYYDPSYAANDNYDYTARIRRFDDNWGDWGYYDDVYTNSYWYSYNPYQFGMSIYMGSPWWGPAYYNYAFAPSFYWGLGYGWGLGLGWGYPYGGWGCYNPYWGWGGGYWNGYNAGYFGGHGYGSYYYNSYDNNSNYYYGPRSSTSSNTAVGYSRGGNGNNTSGSRETFGNMYQNTIRNEAAKNPSMFTAGKNANTAMNTAPLHVAYNSNGSSHFTASHTNVPFSSPFSARTNANSNAGSARPNVSQNFTNGNNRTASVMRSANPYARTANYSRPVTPRYTGYNANNSNRNYNNSNVNRYNSANNRSYGRPYSNQQRVTSGYRGGNGGRSYNGYGGGSRSNYGGGMRSGFSGGHSSFGGGHSGFSGGGHSSGGGGGHSGGGRR